MMTTYNASWCVDPRWRFEARFEATEHIQCHNAIYRKGTVPIGEIFFTKFGYHNKSQYG